MIETLLVFPVMLLMGLGVVHLGLIYQAKSNLEYAALMGARLGAVNHIDIDAMRTEIANRMAPSQIGDDPVNPAYIDIEVLNPTKTMFDDCGIAASEATADCAQANCEIPNFGLQYRASTLTCDGTSIQDANILRIKVTYQGYNTMIPFMNVRLFSGDDENRINQGLPEDGMDISAVATVRMQAPARYTLDNSCCFAEGGG